MAGEVDGTSKGLLGGFAVFTLGSGLASLIYGIFLLIRYVGLEYNYGIFNLFTTSIVLIVVGGLLILTVLLGVIGALKEISNLRVATLVLLFALFATLAGVGVYGMVSFKTGRLQKSIDNDIQLLTETKGGEKLPEHLKQKADYLNRHYNCCGSYASYDARGDDSGIPESCCVVPGCGNNPVHNSPKYFVKGCASVYFETKSVAVYHLAILTLAAAVAVLIALVLYGVVSQRARAGYASVSRG